MAKILMEGYIAFAKLLNYPCWHYILGEKNMKKNIIIFSSLILLACACATVAVTGRKQLNLVSNSEIIPASSAQYSEVLKKGPLSTNQEQVAMVKRVGSR